MANNVRGEMMSMAIVRWLFLLGACALTANPSAQPKTLRVDFYHTGNHQLEIFSVDEVVREPLAWPGNPAQPIDPIPRGKYLFQIIAATSGKTLYSRSFSSIYGEWETTGEARKMTRTFHESLRFPDPGEPFAIVLHKRDKKNAFVEVWRQDIDPNDFLVREASAAWRDQVIEIVHNGDPATKVDLLILGDGYTAGEMDDFAASARSLADALFAVSPFRERREDFNVWALAPTSRVSGVSRPSTGVHIDSPLGASYDAFRSERYVLTYDNRALRDIAASAPYDAIEILTNSDVYGGGGIYGLYSTAAANSDWVEYLFVHEFGHHFAGLADEYYTSPVAYRAPDQLIEPYEPNVTAWLDRGKLKWGHLVTSNTALPTPWAKEKYDTFAREYQAIRVQLREEKRPEREMNALFRENQRFVGALFSRSANRDTIGVFEGANYESEGMYRSQMNCLMFTRSDRFCAVCREGVEDMIDVYSRSPDPFD